MKWGCIQPLTGGMYIGAAEAIGNDADWIISYPGTDEVKYDKSGNITTAGNEYNLLQWLEKNNRNIPYYHFSHNMFEDIPLDNVEINEVSNCSNVPSFDDMDLVVAVPVCSGLSKATIANDDTKKERNCNMVFIAKYVLGVVKPKIYIFENAPALIGDGGVAVREQLNGFAKEYGYSVAYYKTDSKLHDNCQKRPRTFVMFVKWRNGECQTPPELRFIKDPKSVEDVFSRISADAEQNDVTVNMCAFNRCVLDFIIKKIGPDYRYKMLSVDLLNSITSNDWYDEFIEYINNYDMTSIERDKAITYIEHVKYKLSQGLNYYSMSPWFYRDTTPSIQFKTIQSLLHHKENRLLTIRECLNLMGMPNDFILYGNIEANAPKIGQNVPVKTAKWIVSEAVRILKDWDTIPRNDGMQFVELYDNTKQQKL